MVYFLNQLGSCQPTGLLELYNTGLNIQIQKETGIKKKISNKPASLLGFYNAGSNGIKKYIKSTCRLACLGFITLVQMFKSKGLTLRGKRID
jgi:hypothetical protein